jgi:sulfatase modifying factor 1
MRTRWWVAALLVAASGCPIGDLTSEYDASTDGGADVQASDVISGDAPFDGATTDGGVESASDSGCPGTAGPAMVKVGGYCIDTTEVTAAQYAQFLATNPDPGTSGDLSCVAANKTSYAPSTWPNGAIDDRAVVYVDWCDALAFCTWAGKRLCQGVLDDVDAGTYEWFEACTNGRTTPLPYGDASVDFVCNAGNMTLPDGGAMSLAPVKSYKACHGLGAYSAIYDQVGNAREWQGACNGASCDLLGGSWEYSGDTCDEGLGQPVLKTDDTNDVAGFRCCADPL